MQTKVTGATVHEQITSKENHLRRRRIFHVVRKDRPKLQAHVTRNPQDSSNLNVDLHGRNGERENFDASLYLNPMCKAKVKRYYISNCDISDRETKTSLMEEYRKAKKAKLENPRKRDDRIGYIAQP